MVDDCGPMVDGYGMVRGIDVGVRRYLVMDSSSWPTGQGLGPTTSVGEVTSERGKEDERLQGAPLLLRGAW